MKKLRLKALSLGAREILSREQLKAVTGGFGCESALDCPLDYWCPAGECVYGGSPNGSDPSTVSGSNTCTTAQNTPGVNCEYHGCQYGCLTYEDCMTAVFASTC